MLNFEYYPGNRNAMFAKKIGFALLTFALVSPALAGAQSVNTQIALLLAQVKQLQTQIAQLEGQSGQAPCVNLSSDLTLGSTGGDVTNLQNYLIAKGDLSPQYNTGYYGFLTAQAVGKLQVSLGIVSSSNDPVYGIMGPQTRGTLTCQNQTAEAANSPQPSVSSPTAPAATLTASPSSGTAPLSVTFTTSPIASSALGGGIPSILFGNAVGTMQQFTCPQSTAACIYTASHIYSSSGIYSVSALSPLQTILASTSVSVSASTVGATNAISAIIDPNALVGTSPTPIITGTFFSATGGPGPEVVVSTSPLPSDAIETWSNNDLSTLSPQNGVVWKDITSAYGHYNSATGRYSVTINTPLASGSALTNDSVGLANMRIWRDENGYRGAAWSGGSRSVGSGRGVAEQSTEARLASADRAAERGWDRNDGDSASDRQGQADDLALAGALHESRR